jgi:peptide-methionine (S)-S-oxide reductase
LGDHTEALQVDFDPEKTSYRNLLSEIFKRQDPFNNIGHTQYQNGIWYHGREQKEAVDTVMNDLYGIPSEADKIETRIEPIGEFYRAEDYHQKYYLRKHEQYMELFEDLSGTELTDSTLAARLNGILAGKASSLEPFDRIVPQNFPDVLQRDLQSRVS